MPVKLGVIGCGAIAQRRHLPEALSNPAAKIVAVCDVNSERVQTIAKLYNATPFTDHRTLLKNADIDAIVVCTPNKFHAPQTIDALEARKHVLVEKPMATTRDEAKTMIATAKKNKKFLMVGQNQRLMAPHVKAKEILNSGKLGTPIAFQTTFKHPGPDGWSVDGAKSWFFKKSEAIMGVTGDLGVHKADLMRYLLGQEFAEVNGFIGTIDKKDPATGKPISVDDNAFLSLKTKLGVIGSMTISWTNYGGMEDNGTTIFCQNGVLFIGADPNYGVVVNYKSGEREYHKLGAVATNTKQVASGIMDMFINGIVENIPPSIDGGEGYKSLDVILTAMDAAMQGKTLKVGGK
jgi:UDP-N-acetylglucosamine 3-dehydrogenase